MDIPINLNFSDKRKQHLYLITLALVIGFILATYTISLFAFISPNADLRWETSITNYDQPNYIRGDTVTLTGFLEEGTAYFNIIQYYYYVTGETVTWGVVVLDPNRMPVYIETGTLVDAQGDVTLNDISFPLSSSASIGTYKVRIMVWSDLLPSGETRTLTIDQGSFQVVS